MRTPNPTAPSAQDAVLADAKALSAAGDFERAASRLTKALKKGPKTPARYVALAEAHLSLNAPKRALAALQEARETFGALAPLENTRFRALIVAGRLDKLDAQFARVMEVGLSARTLFAYAEYKRFDVPDELLGVAQTMRARTASGGDEQRRLDAALAAIYDKRGDVDRAFDRLEALAASYPAAPVRRFAEEIRSVDGATTPTPTPIQPKRRNDGLPIAVFIVGMPRSGSTWIAETIAAHPKATSIDESQAFARALDAAMKRIQARRPEARTLGAAAEAAEADDLLELRATYLRLAARDAGAGVGSSRVYVDKNLTNHRHVAFIRAALPDAAIVHTFRHPMACLFSIMERAFDRAHAYKRSPETLAERHRDYEAVMSAWDDALPGAVVHVDHAAMRDAFEDKLRRLLDSVDIPFDPACLAPGAGASAVRSSSAIQLRQGVSDGGTPKWRRYRHKLGPLIEALGGEEAIEERFSAWRAKAI